MIKKKDVENLALQLDAKIHIEKYSNFMQIYIDAPEGRVWHENGSPCLCESTEGNTWHKDTWQDIYDRMLYGHYTEETAS